MTDRERGLVTVELALATLAVAVIVLGACWGLLALITQLRCVDTAAEVARQAARGDEVGVAAARADRPAGAKVIIERTDGLVRTRVTARMRPFGVGALPAITLRAEATAVVEPGEPR